MEMRAVEPRRSELCALLDGLLELSAVRDFLTRVSKIVREGCTHLHSYAVSLFASPVYVLQWATTGVLQGPGDFEGEEEGVYNEDEMVRGYV